MTFFRFRLRPAPWLAALALVASGTAAGASSQAALPEALPMVVTGGVAALSESARSGDPTSRRHGPLPFAEALPLAADLGHGVWDRPEPGVARWRLQVVSPGARSLSLRLDRFSAPPEAELWLIAADGSMRQGPYRAADTDARGRLWTALVYADEAVVELRLPEALRESARLEIGTAHHGYRDLRKNINGNIGNSESCQIDVACPQGAAWQPQIRATAGITIEGVAFCTGTLVNNSAQDQRPLFLTAHHCGIREAEAASVVVYWNFQADACGVEPPPTFEDSQSGSRLLATHSRSDHTLLELNQLPDPAFDVFYSGWDASSSPRVDGGAGIHHPSGDIKKISLFTEPALPSIDTVNGQTVDNWQVTWSQGLTEGGSSGSGLWNADGLLIGELFAGTPPNCSGTNIDNYGRLQVAWEGGGTPASRMRDHLDPDNRLSQSRRLDGLDPRADEPGQDPGDNPDNGDNPPPPEPPPPEPPPPPPEEPPPDPPPTEEPSPEPPPSEPPPPPDTTPPEADDGSGGEQGGSSGGGAWLPGLALLLLGRRFGVRSHPGQRL